MENEWQWLLSNRAGYLGCSLTFFWVLRFLVAAITSCSSSWHGTVAFLFLLLFLLRQRRWWWVTMDSDVAGEVQPPSVHGDADRGSTSARWPYCWPRRWLELESSLRAGNFQVDGENSQKCRSLLFPLHIAFQCLNCLRSDCGLLANRTWFLSFSVTWAFLLSQDIMDWEWLESRSLPPQFKRLRTGCIVEQRPKIIRLSETEEKTRQRLTAKTRDRGPSLGAQRSEMSEPWTSTSAAQSVWHSESTCTWMHSFPAAPDEPPNSILGNGWMGLGAPNISPSLWHRGLACTAPNLHLWLH